MPADAVTISVIVASVVLLALYLAVRAVQPYERMVILRLGRADASSVREPGLRFVIPVMDRSFKVDIREKVVEGRHTATTKDKTRIYIDLLIYWRIVDPLRSVLMVPDFGGALHDITTTTLPAVMGKTLLDDVLTNRDPINELLRAQLNKQAKLWGGDVTQVEIRDVIVDRVVNERNN